MQTPPGVCLNSSSDMHAEDGNTVPACRSGNVAPLDNTFANEDTTCVGQHSDSLLAGSATVTGRVATSVHDKNLPLLQLQSRALRLRNQLLDSGVECVDALGSWSGLKRILALGGFDVETDCGWPGPWSCFRGGSCPYARRYRMSCGLLGLGFIGKIEA